MHTCSLVEGPQEMQLNEKTLIWKPTEADAGTHNIELLISDGLAETKKNFTFIF